MTPETEYYDDELPGLDDLEEHEKNQIDLDGIDDSEDEPEEDDDSDEEE